MSAPVIVSSEFSFTPTVGQHSILSAFSYKTSSDSVEASIPFRRTYFKIPLGELTTGSFTVEKCVAYGIDAINAPILEGQSTAARADHVLMKTDFPKASIISVPKETSTLHYLEGDFYVDAPASLRLQCLILTSPDAVFIDHPMASAEAAMSIFPDSKYSHGKSKTDFNLFAASNSTSYTSASNNNKLAEDIIVTAGGIPNSADGGLILSLNSLSRDVSQVKLALGTAVSWVLIEPLFSLAEAEEHAYQCVSTCNDISLPAVEVTISGNYQGYKATIPTECKKGQNLIIACPDAIVFPRAPGIPAVAHVSGFSSGEMYSMYAKAVPVAYKSGVESVAIFAALAATVASVAAILL